MSFVSELKRRNVIRVGVAWLALTWLLVAIANLLFPAMDMPISAVRWHPAKATGRCRVNCATHSLPASRQSRNYEFC